jgi:hypothetical protein
LVLAARHRQLTDNSVFWGTLAFFPELLRLVVELVTEPTIFIIKDLSVVPAVVALITEWGLGRV